MKYMIFLRVLYCMIIVLIGGACSSDRSVNDTETAIEESAIDISANNDTETAIEESAIDISAALFTNRDANCASYVNQYFSNVMNVQTGSAFSGDLQITLAGTKCIFTSNAIPNHDFNDGGSFATPVSTQQATHETITVPTAAATSTTSIFGDNAIFLNGVKLDLLAAACYDVGSAALGREKIGCGPNEINHPWRYDPMSPLNTFGTDKNNAHTQPDGTYHYHGNPMAMFESACQSVITPSPVIGFAADGFPIYGSCINVDGSIRQVESSYRLKDGGGDRQVVVGYRTPVAGQGNIASANYDGQFRGDYEYAADLGDLDECNGMTVDGQYGYYITATYPWVLACYKGTPDNSFAAGRPN